MKKTLIAILVLGICLATLGTASAATYTIKWGAVTKYTDGSTISGQSVTYSVYWSTSLSMSPANAIATGISATSRSFDPATLGMKAGNTVYFAVKASIGGGTPSEYSTPKSWIVPSGGATTVEPNTISWGAVTKYSDGSTISGQSVTYSVYWSSSPSMSSPSTIATGVTGTSRSFDPVALGMKAGNTVYFAVKASVGGGTPSDYSPSKSWNVPGGGVTTTTLSSIAINGASSVNEETSSTYTATATWSNGTTSTVTPTWSVSSTTYATINASGALTAKSVTADRTVTVNATYTSAGITKTASKTVTIKDVPATLNSIEIIGAASVNEGTSASYTTTATWSDGTRTTVTPTWSLSSTTYATINASGALTAKSVTADRTVTVNATYTSAGITKTASKTV
ncbi:MAG: hypothetical protein FWF95_05170, partial [Syntrophorhabdaceae bacterium]|nr:hypothetical protein [Syntrophorhabdaceae bacterium]